MSLSLRVLVGSSLLLLLLLAGGCSRSQEAPEEASQADESAQGPVAAEDAPTAQAQQTMELGWRVMAMDLRADGARALLCGRAADARKLAELELATMALLRTEDLPEGAGCAVSYGVDGSSWVSYAVNGRGTVREWTPEGLVESEPRDARVPFGRWQDAEGRTLRSRRMDDGRRALIRDPGPAGAPIGTDPADPMSRSEQILVADRIQLVDFDDRMAVIQVWEGDSASGRVIDLGSLTAYTLPEPIAATNISGRAGVNSERLEVCVTARDPAGSVIHLFSFTGEGLRSLEGLPASTGGRCAVLPDGRVLTTTQTGLLVAAI